VLVLYIVVGVHTWEHTKSIR